MAEAVPPLEHLMWLCARLASDYQCCLMLCRWEIGSVAAFGGHSASADQPKVHQPSVYVMQREAWEGKHGVQCGCADACVAA